MNVSNDNIIFQHVRKLTSNVLLTLNANNINTLFWILVLFISIFILFYYELKIIFINKKNKSFILNKRYFEKLKISQKNLTIVLIYY